MNKEQVLGVVRHILTFVGGVLVIRGVVDETLLQELVGGIVALTGTIWSVISKKEVVQK